MSTRTVVDQICVFFGGAYQPQFRYYGTPQIAGLGVVRRAQPKDPDAAELYLGMVDGAENGALMVVEVAGGAEQRKAMAGPFSGAKKVSHTIRLNIRIRSVARDSEDIEDFTRGLLDDIRDRIHGDRTCGSGGLEVGGFQVGEDYDGPGSDVIEWSISDVATSTGVSKQSLFIHFSASEYIEA